MENKFKTKNMFIEGVKKFIGQTVRVVFFNPDSADDFLIGKLETIDYVQRSVIIQCGKERILIPRYKYLTGV